MTLLETIIGKLNAIIDAYNVKLKESVDVGELTGQEAEFLRVPAGSITAEMVKAGPKEWSKPIRIALREVIVSEDPTEIVRMADACTVETETIKHLRIGSRKSIGFQPGDMHGFPVGIRLMDMAHLVSHSGAERAILLG